MKNKLIIGVPVKNDLESLKEMIKSLYESTNVNYTLMFIIGKECNDETINYLTNLPFKKGIAVIIPDTRTHTPLDAYNVLFKTAELNKSDLFVTQTDVLFPKLYKRDWLYNMRQIAKDESIGAITSINGGGISGPDYINGFEWLGGWCTYYPYRTLEKIGGFDKNFPNGYGVDIDHTYRLYKTGLKILKVNYWVDHHMMNERVHDKDSNTEQMKKESSEYFKKKWNLK